LLRWIQLSAGFLATNLLKRLSPSVKGHITFVEHLEEFIAANALQARVVVAAGLVEVDSEDSARAAGSDQRRVTLEPFADVSKLVVVRALDLAQSPWISRRCL